MPRNYNGKDGKKKSCSAYEKPRLKKFSRLKRIMAEAPSGTPAGTSPE